LTHEPKGKNEVNGIRGGEEQMGGVKRKYNELSEDDLADFV